MSSYLKHSLVCLVLFSGCISIAVAQMNTSARLTKNLLIGSTDQEVVLLKQVLIREKLLDASITSTYYGTQTAVAVKKFQEKYKSEILTPQGLSYGTGRVGPGTRKKINEILSGVTKSTPPSNTVSPSSSGATYNFTRALKLGDVHADVKKLQQFLNSVGYVVAPTGPGSPGSETTYFGAKTTAAIARFQKDHEDLLASRSNGSAQVNGILDAPTRAVINAVASSQPSDRMSPAPSPLAVTNTNQTRVQNAAPVVNAGLDQTVQLPNVVYLRAVATDDHTAPENLSYTWTKISGPGVTFSNTRTAQTSISFSQTGVYQFDVVVSDGALTSNDTVTVTVTTVNVDASPSPNQITRYVLLVRGAGTGAGMISGSGISCGNRCTDTYIAGTRVELSAATVGNSNFTGWSGDCSGTQNCVLVMNSNKTVTATFTQSPNQGTGVNPPSAPQSLQSRATPNSVTLSWSGTSDSSVRRYKIRRGNVEIAEVGRQNSFTDTGLNPGTEYSYAVSAVDANGNASPSSSVTVRTPAAPSSGGLADVATSNYIVLWSTIQESPPRITINWLRQSTPSQITIYRKESVDASWGQPVATLPGSVLSYVDSNVISGRSYWYKVDTAGGDSAQILVTIHRPLVDSRGVVLLVVENSLLTNAADEISVLTHDLVAEGWRVVRIPVSRTESVQSVKEKIRTEYNRAPNETKAAYLLGHVPVPYSGFLAPDGHGDHYGAWSTDTYYGDVDGVWTDTALRLIQGGWPNNFHGGEGSLRAENRNFPNDGKFDQIAAPTALDIAVGRVDFSNLPQFLPRSELYLTKQYIRKSHDYRVGQRPLPESALIHPSLGASFGFGYNAQKGLSAAFTPYKVSMAHYPVGLGQGSLMTFLDSTAYFEGLYNVQATTQSFSQNDPPTYFYEMFGSYFGDFDVDNNLLRAALGGKEYGLTNAWGGSQLLSFSLGDPIGESYTMFNNLIGRSVTRNLMGDPTLRLHTLRPPANLQFSVVNNQLKLSWDAVSYPVLGYHVYRSTQSVGPYERLTSEIVSDTSFVDTVVGGSPATYYYMVRAVEYKISGAGSYENISPGIIRTAVISRSSTGGFSVARLNPVPELPALADPITSQRAPTTPTIYAVSVEPNVVTAGDKMTITYRFGPGPVDQPYRVFTHFRKDGAVVFADEHRFPVPPMQWNEEVTYRVPLRIPITTPAGNYTIVSGMYSGDRGPEFNPGPGVEVLTPKNYQVGAFQVINSSVSISNVRVGPASVGEGQRMQITWDSAGVDRVNITIGNAVQDFAVLATGIANTGNFDWTVISGVASPGLTVKVTDASNSIVTGVSPEFTITDSVPPHAPLGLSSVLRTTETGIRYLEITWQQNTDDAESYKLFVGRQSGNYTITTDVSGQPYYYVTPDSGNYYLALKAVDLSGNESGFSSEVVAAVPGNGTGTPLSSPPPISSPSPALSP